jgi:hypothetical protein
MTNDECRRNDEIRMTNLAASISFRHLSIRACFVIRHSCFVIDSHLCFGVAHEVVCG